MALAPENIDAVKNELKQEVAIEAAQDPQSNVSAEDAQKVLVNESKKAGVPAYQFDPDAPPEQKRAQVKMVISHLSSQNHTDSPD